MSNLTLTETATLKIAVEGCGHGSLDIIYQSLEKACESRGWGLADLDFLIICGDFQAIRNQHDLNCMSIPWKYREMGDFHRYYSGEKKAPVLTLVIGGNHEASNYLSELHYGGWLAQNIYYMGAVSVLRYGPFRVAGISGIFHGADYHKPHHERLPYDRNEIRSIYHVRESDISKLLQIRRPVDVGISHDWPRRVEWFGDYKQLFVDRPTFFESVKVDNLGSPPAEQVMNHLRPRYWFSGHMHVKYAAVVHHHQHNSGNIFKNIAIANDIQKQLPKSLFGAALREKGTPKSSPPEITNTITHFLALDKPGPDRDFLELLEVDLGPNIEDISAKHYMEKTSEGRFALHYDEEWLSIIRSSENKLDMRDEPLSAVLENSDDFPSSTNLTNLEWVNTNITAKGLLKIPENFERHAPTYNPHEKVGRHEQPPEYPNSQTEAFCKMLWIRKETSEIVDVATHDDFVVFE